MQPTHSSAGRYWILPQSWADEWDEVCSETTILCDSLCLSMHGKQAKYPGCPITAHYTDVVALLYSIGGIYFH